MRARHADMFQLDRKRRATLIVPHDGEDHCVAILEHLMAEKVLG
jgi:hypothetical protein